MRRGLGVLLAIGAFVPMGCDGLESDRLVIATTWPRADRDRIAIQFGEWVAAERPAQSEMSRIAWLILEPRDNPAACRHDTTRPTCCWAGPRPRATGWQHRNRIDSPLQPRTLYPPGC